MIIAKNETNVTALSDVDLTTVTFKSYDYAKLYLNAKCKNFTLMANDKSKIELNLKSEKYRYNITILTVNGLSTENTSSETTTKLNDLKFKKNP